MSTSGKLVLVTGASGYLGAHCVKAALEAGYRVRGTVRSLGNEAKVGPLRKLCSEEGRLELVEADLLQSASWAGAVAGCDFVLHTASPFATSGGTEESFVKPAVEGTRSVLNAAAAEASVKKVVLTSSVVAVSAGHPQRAKPFDEHDWSDLNAKPPIAHYDKSKTLAEQEAWELAKTQNLRLTTINPGFIIGPLVHDSAGASSDLIGRILRGEMPAIPRLWIASIDVRDVAKAHVKALTVDASDGKRIILARDAQWMKKMAEILAAEFTPLGYKVTNRQAPDLILKGLALFDGEVKRILPALGRTFTFDNNRMQSILGMTDTIPLEKSLIDMGHSLIARNFVSKLPTYKAPAQN